MYTLYSVHIVQCTSNTIRSTLSFIIVHFILTLFTTYCTISITHCLIQTVYCTVQCYLQTVHSTDNKWMYLHLHIRFGIISPEFTEYFISVIQPYSIIKKGVWGLRHFGYQNNDIILDSFGFSYKKYLIKLLYEKTHMIVAL